MAGTFHHMGIPTTEPKPGERFSERFGMYTSDSNCGLLRIQWDRFEPDSLRFIVTAGIDDGVAEALHLGLTPGTFWIMAR
jgi:hypothetical protein